jgi:hypothetical protein
MPSFRAKGGRFPSAMKRLSMPPASPTANLAVSLPRDASMQQCPRPDPTTE